MNQPFEMVVNSAFSIKGRGTILEGSITQGAVSVGDKLRVESPTNAQIDTVQALEKTDQSFTTCAKAGEKISILFSSFDLDKFPDGVKRVYDDKGFYHHEVTTLSVRAAQSKPQTKPFWKFW